VKIPYQISFFVLLLQIGFHDVLFLLLNAQQLFAVFPALDLFRRKKRFANKRIKITVDLGFIFKNFIIQIDIV